MPRKEIPVHHEAPTIRPPTSMFVLRISLISLGGVMAESSPSGNYLVRVRAQVMTRDDSTGGWVPMGVGGLSNVSVRKRELHTEEEDKYEYLIYGKMISDQSVVLSCTIKRDFEYNKVMPTFHHWKTGDKKFGLTFQTAADARAFDKGVHQAVDDLHDDVGEDDVFMQLELPVERGDSRSSSGSSTNGGGSCGYGCPSSTTPSLSAEPYSSPYIHNHPHLHKVHYMARPQRTSPTTPNGQNGQNGQNGSSLMTISGDKPRSKEAEDVWLRNEKYPGGQDKKKPNGDDKVDIIQSDSYSYVQFARDERPSPHEYSYPMVDALKVDKVDAVSSIKKHEVKPPLLPTKTKKKRGRKKEKHKHLLMDRERCIHCHEMFSHEDNERGSCEYAPDCIRSCINAVTCIKCAQCMLYHCMSDAEGDFARHPCSCDTDDDMDDHCGKRWVGLAILSFLVPCLWCYLPLRACHRCGIGFCGGRHEASSS